jgi:hypothetical protein
MLLTSLVVWRANPMQVRPMHSGLGCKSKRKGSEPQRLPH